MKPCNIASGLMMLFGKAVAHALVMDQIGFPYLSPAIYYYAVGREDKALPFIMNDDLSGHFYYSVCKVKYYTFNVCVIILWLVKE